MVATGCSMDGARTVNTTGPNAIISVNGTEPQNGLITTNTAENGGGRVVDALFTGLYSYDADGKPSLANAESVDTTDNQNYTIHLRRTGSSPTEHPSRPKTTFAHGISALRRRTPNSSRAFSSRSTDTRQSQERIRPPIRCRA